MDLAAVYSRQIDGRKLTLVPSGWTYKNTFVLYDKETETLWYPDEGGLVGIQGPYYGRKLEEVPSEDVSWKEWVKKHPETKILK